MRGLERTFAPDRQVQARGMPASEDRSARGRAHRHRIGLGEPHAFLRQPIQVRGSVQVGPITAQVTLAQIVGEDKDHVRGARTSESPTGKQDGQDRCATKSSISQTH
jgi:hypothetical protein